MNRAVLQKEFNRDEIDILKNDTSVLSSFFETKNDSSIVYVLENLGRLENGHGKKPLLKLLSNKNENIRLLAIKNLAKIGHVSLLEIFLKFANEDESTEVRRESVSAIGRLRNEKTIPILIKLLSDKDPKVVMQAIRGLLVFSKNILVKRELKKLIDHPNELIKEVIGKEINGVSYSSNSKEKHDKFPNYLKNIVVQGDVVETLSHVPDESVHLTFTSPLISLPITSLINSFG